MSCLWWGLEFSSTQDSNDRRVWGHQAAILGKTVPTLAWRQGIKAGFLEEVKVKV